MTPSPVKFQSPAALLGLAQDMINKDWQPVWCPQRQSGSFSPEPGCTGGVGFPAILPQPQVAHKLAFRPPPDVLVIDVDHYGEKLGMDTMDRAEEWLGPLPETFRVTSRGYENPSGRYLYRIPPDLLVTDSSLSQFAGDDGSTDVEIVRTGHRFSWSPGDYHYKNNELIRCYDEFGDEHDMPFVADLPYLPERWVTYFRNPPVPQKHEVYTRPSDGAEWWLSQADNSLGSDAELASFAYNMLLSRVPEEEIFEQWMRVSKADDPSWQWERKDFDRHVGSRAQQKAGKILEHQDEETAWFAGTGADLGRISEQAKEGFENRQSLMSAVTQPVVGFQPELMRQGFDRLGYVSEEEEYEDQFYVPKKKTLEDQLRDLDSYQRLLFDQLARIQANKDAAKILAGNFEGYEDISNEPDPEKPCLLSITSTPEGQGTYIISPNTVTVVSGHRSSGKTWLVATWAAQELRAGNHVIWVDFERQSRLLNQKLRALKIQQHLIASQVHYTGGVIPPTERLVSDIKKYTSEGKRVLVVVDAFRGLQGIISPGSSANDGDAVEAVYLSVLNPVAAKDAGGTVVVIDHLSKAGDKGTFGSERKESAADYVIQVEQAVSFSKRKSGYSTLTVTKDRYGEVEAGTMPGYLWVPGDDDKPKKDTGIDFYPVVPEVRSWSPVTESPPEDSDVSRMAQLQVAAVAEFVRAHPRKYNQQSLAKKLCDDNPTLFGNAESLRTNIISKKMVKSSPPILTADSKHNLEWVKPVTPADEPAIANKPDPEALLGDADHQDNQ